MSYRRRHRWFRRLASGLAFASLAFAGGASVAYAKPGEDTTVAPSQRQSPIIVGEEVESKAAIGGAAVDPYLTDVFVRPGESLGGPDGLAPVKVSSTRPDDARNRFAHSDVPGQPQLESGGWTFDADEALTMGIGAIVLALGLGLALGYVRRPRIAGL